MSFLEIANYTKMLKRTVVLDRVCLNARRGEAIGIIGANGSGKTMLLRAICGLIFPSSGEVRIDGKRIGTDISFPPSVGVVLENVSLWPYDTGMENLRSLAGIKKCIGDDEIRQALLRVGLESEDKRIYKKYSLGMKQRLSIAQAIMEAPELLLLDEPTNGLDEDGVQLIHHVILEEKARGAAILLTSHNPNDIERLCDRVFVMKAGRLEERDKIT